MWLRFGPSDLSDSLGFSDSSGSLHLKNSGRIHSKGRRRGGLLSMTESQTQAYLTARDVLRRIQRSSCQHFDEEVGETDTRHRSSTTRTRIPSVEGGIEPLGKRA